MSSVPIWLAAVEPSSLRTFSRVGSTPEGLCILPAAWKTRASDQERV